VLAWRGMLKNQANQLALEHGAQLAAEYAQAVEMASGELVLKRRPFLPASAQEVRIVEG